MRLFLFMVLFAALYCASGDDNLITLMDHVVVLMAPNAHTRFNVPLMCGESYKDQSVFWKRNGHELNPALVGNKVSAVVEEMAGGKYTCHLSTGGDYLNYTMVLVQLSQDHAPVILEDMQTSDGAGSVPEHIQCSGHNYNSSFYCTWRRKASRSTAAVLLVKANRGSEKIDCELDAEGLGVWCQENRCPYKEEQQRISIIMYIHSNARLEEYATSFYLHDIVTPESIPNLRHTGAGVFRWDYPESWEKPCSYYGLQFQVKLVRPEEPCHSGAAIGIKTPDFTEGTEYTVFVRAKKYTFCIRARDKFTEGPWSSWSHVVKDHKTHQ